MRLIGNLTPTKFKKQYTSQRWNAFPNVFPQTKSGANILEFAAMEHLKAFLCMSEITNLRLPALSNAEKVESLFFMATSQLADLL